VVFQYVVEKGNCTSMHNRYVALVLLVLLCSSNGAVKGQEKTPVFSGPQAGERLAPIPVVLVYGKEAGMTVDLVKRAAGRPTLLVFVNGANRPAARLTRILMHFAEIHRKTLFAGVVYLHGDRTAAEQQLKRAVSWWQVGSPVGVSVDGAEGPGSYGLNRNVNLTVLVANKGRVTSNHALVQPSEADAAAILKNVVALAGGRVPTEAEVAFLSYPTRKPPNVRWRSAPTDATLRNLICRALAASDESTARAAAAAVDKYVGVDKARQRALGNAVAILLDSRGRVPVAKLPIAGQLRSWHKKHGPPPRQ
jgi:hypothetical protein